MKNSKFLILLFLIVLSSSFFLDYDYERGKTSCTCQKFCVDYDYKEIPIRKDTTLGYVHSFDFGWDGSINEVLLTQPYHRHCNSHYWLANRVDVQNGFVTEFVVDIGKHTCFESGFNYIRACGVYMTRCQTVIQYQKKCGAEGFAFILQNSNKNASGLAGTGLGYETIQDVFAVEFDFLYSPNKNDPYSTDEGHISVIAKKGKADADEKNAIVYNYNPIDFRNGRVLFRVEYLNKNLRVFVNNVLQIGYYLELDFNKILGSTKFYMGFTASNTEAGSSISLKKWNAWLVSPRVLSSSLQLVPSQSGKYSINERFSINLYLQTGCGAKYTPSIDSDFIDSLDWDSSRAKFCKLLETKFPDSTYNKNAPSAQFDFSCTKSGVYTFSFLFDNKNLAGSVDVKVGSNGFESAKVDFFAGNVGNIETAFQFRVVGYDQYNEIVEIEETFLKSVLNIEWPNYLDTKKDWTLIKRADGSFTVSLKTDKVGVFKVISEKFKKFQTTGFYEFTIEAGDMNPINSFGRLLDKTTNIIITDTLQSGNDLVLNVYPKDRAGNSISSSKLNPQYLKVILNVNGKTQELKDPIKNKIFFTYFFSVSTAGNGFIKISYLGKDLTCEHCQFKVLPTSLDFSNTQIAQYDNKTNNFPKTNSTVFTTFKGDNFLFQVYFLDSFNNEISPPTFLNGWRFTIDGNYMRLINLVPTNIGTAIKLEVNKQDDFYYKNLVGKSGYQIAISNNFNEVKTWNLTIISDNGDRGAGNGELDLSKTIWFWLNPLVQNQYAIAGENYRVAVQLYTFQNERYNGFIDTKLVITNLDPFFSNIGETISAPRITEICGTYTVTFKLIRGILGKRILGFNVGGVKVERVQDFLDYPASPFRGFVNTDSLEKGNRLIQGVIGQNYEFGLMIVDKFNNPNNYNDKNGVVSLRNKATGGITIPECKTIERGNYKCRVNSDVSGEFNVESSYFKTDPTSYILIFALGKPDNINSYGEIIDDLTKPVKISDIITFKITVKDVSGNLLLKNDVSQYIDSFLLNLQEPSSNKLQTITIKNLDNSGSIVYKVLMEKAGLNTFLPTYLSQKITCHKCSVAVIDNQETLPSIKTYILVNNNENLLAENALVTLDNQKTEPFIIIRFFDPSKTDFQVPPPQNTLISCTLKCIKSAIATYSFVQGSWTTTSVKFALKDSDVNIYHKELRNEKCTLSIDLKPQENKINPINLSRPAVLKGNGTDDDDYSNDIPDPDKVTFVPYDFTFIAGEYQTVTVELRTTDEKLFNHPDTFGWYNLDVESFKLDKEDGGRMDVGAEKGVKKGTYLLRFTSYVAYINGIYLQFSYLDTQNPGKFIKITKRIKIVVFPAALNYLILDDSSIKNGLVGERKTLSMNPYDLYGNLIYKLAVNSINLQITNTNPLESLFKPTLTQTSDGEILAVYQAYRPGLITIKSIRFRNTNKKTIANYNYTVSVGPIDNTKSLAVLDKESIKAGESVRWSVYPRDQYENALVCNMDIINGLSASITLFNTKNINEKALSISNNEYCYWDYRITEAGTHQFKALTGLLLISSSKSRVVVNSAEPDFNSFSLSLLDLKTNQYFEYDGKKFSQDLTTYPDFKVLIKDQFGNLINSAPTFDRLTLFLTNYELKKNGIYFCYYPSTLNFKMCSDTKLQPKLKLPGLRYKDLIVPRDYDLVLSNIGFSPKVFLIGLTGKADDGSNDDIDEQKTIIQPMTIVTGVNEIGEIIITLMTTSNIRKNEWFENPEDVIKLTFSGQNVEYKLTEGPKKGIYKASFQSKVSWSEPNMITININGVDVINKKVSWIVKSSIPSLYQPYDNIKKIVSKETVSGSTDSSNTQFFIAKDQFGNQLNLNLDTPGVNTLLLGPDNSIVQHVKTFPLDSDAIKIDFEPKMPGVYRIEFDNNNKFEIKIFSGSVDIPKSIGTISPEYIIAGESISIIGRFNDRWGNKLELTDNILKNNKFKYHYAEPGSDIYIDGANSYSIDNVNFVVNFTQSFTKKGVYKIKISVNSQSIDMLLARVTVFPGPVHLPSCILSYLDDSTNKYLLASKDIPIKEENTKYDPKYQIQLSDKYGNLYDDFPQNYASQVIVILFGNDIDQKNPINFFNSQIQGFNLLINIKDSDKSRYQSALAKKTPYNLKITLNSQPNSQLLYLVDLLGDGNNDDAETEKPLDISKTVLSKDSLKFVAGGSDIFGLELRTTNNKRKADAGDVNIQAVFDPKDVNTTYSISKGDAKGRYIISITGIKANERTKPTIISIIINGVTVPKTVKLTITADILNRIEIISNLNKNGVTDTPYEFQLIPYDQYNNIANVKPDELNLQVNFPLLPNNERNYKGTSDPSSGTITFIVEGRNAGFYEISSPFLSEQQKFLINSGKINEKYTYVNANPNRIKVGESVSVSITPFDFYNNQIDCLLRKTDCQEAITLTSVQNNVNTLLNNLPILNSDLSYSNIYKIVGTANLVLSIYGKTVACADCGIIIENGLINMGKTQWYMENSDEIPVRTTYGSIPAGSFELKVYARLFDEFDNPIQIFQKEESFTSSISGNNMTPLDLEVVKEGNIPNQLTIRLLNNNDKVIFQELVASKNYLIQLKYLHMSTSVRGNSDLPLELTGLPDDSGNGECDLTKTFIDPTQISLIAGIESFVKIELRTKENKRCRQRNDIAKIYASETNDSKGEEKLNLGLAETDRRNRFSLGLKGYKTLKASEIKKVQISFNGIVLNQTIIVTIEPNLPDAGKTEIIQSMPFNLVGDQVVDVSIRLFDQYGNIYNKPDYSSYIFGKASSGNATFNTPKFDAKNNVYIIAVQAKYPPRVLETNIYISVRNTNINYPLLNVPWFTQVLNQIDYGKTELRGALISGVEIGQDFVFYIILKDTNGFCYEATKDVSVVISGAYANQNLNDNTLATGSLKNSFTLEAFSKGIVAEEQNEFNVNGQSCLKYYQVISYGNQIQNIGFYQIDVYVDKLTNPVLKQRTYVSSGQFNPNNILLSLQSISNPDSQLKLPVGTQLTFNIILRDNFKNKISDISKIKCEIGISGYEPNKDYKATIEAKSNIFVLILTVFKVGKLPSTLFTINNKQVSWSDVDKQNFPESFTFTSDKCSPKYPSIDVSTLFLNQTIVGSKAVFKVKCFDQFNNEINIGGEQFQAQIITTQNNLPNVDSTAISVKVNDLSTGTYDFEFRPTWSGLYKLIIRLGGNPYGEAIFFLIKDGLCSSTTPFYCVNTKKCVKSYSECNLPILKGCTDKQKPIRCKVQEKDTCVQFSYQCDCPRDFTKCTADQKCVDSFLTDVQCSTKGQNPSLITCDSPFSYQCQDGSCRKSITECPSLYGCPPGFKLCIDLTCIDSSKECPNKGENECPSNLFYRCDDYSCTDSPENCPTRITCPQQNQIVCPDQTCADSELQCKIPNICEDGLLLCLDGSCSKSYSDCPRGITCPWGNALCSDGICRSECSILKSKPRLLQNETNEVVVTINAPKTFCSVGETLCSDSSCVKSVSQCIQRTCPSSKTLCWDNTCSDNLKECPSKIYCPKDYQYLCSDGSCVEKGSDCPSSVQCPTNSPIRCSSGVCRKSYEECPVQTTCPEKYKYRCSDGSCVRSPEDCKLIVEISKCPQGLYRCGDGSCSESLSLCPSVSTCREGQITCWNLQCAENEKECPLFPEQTCDGSKLRCPDGSCASSLENCPTNLICPDDRPIKCDDGNCRASVDQCIYDMGCPLPFKKCPDGSCTKGKCGSLSVTCSKLAPYKCFDNTCRKDPNDCPKIPECSMNTPILCGDGTCVTFREECTSYEPCPFSLPVRCPDEKCHSSAQECIAIKGCPSNKVLCEDGSCFSHISLCPTKKCPPHLPYKCKEGQCVSDNSQCDLSNGCPFSLPFKCTNGQCVSKYTECPTDVKCLEPNKHLCPDGSCQPLDQCPLQNGCPAKSPLLCASGECINPNKTTCPIFSCPKHLPFKCPDGLCQSSSSACPLLYNPLENSECYNENKLQCADGSCVTHLDQCKPTFTCNRDRCDDGSCRNSRDLCPLSPNTCPKSQSFRCPNRACVAKESDCVTESGCPVNTNKCDKYGLCAENDEKCEELASNINLPNGCFLNKPFYCIASGNCVKNETECKEPKKCPISTPFSCPDGACVANITSCRSVGRSLLLQTSCPQESPFQCADGTCHSYLTIQTCEPYIQCSPYKNHLCADLECVALSYQCKVTKNCPLERPIRCDDLSCVSSLENCPKKNICPPGNPVKCRDGRCVDSIFDCQPHIEELCSKELPYRCSNGQCVEAKALCIKESDRNNASSQLCWDGSIRENTQDCPVSEGCWNIELPFRCQSGKCGANEEDCKNIDNILGNCSNGTKRCEDGLCREKCLNFDGCPLEKPLQCMSGVCGISINDCLNEKNETICSDNSLVESADKCYKPYNSLKTKDILITNSIYLEQTVRFVLDEVSSFNYVEINIPAGSFKNISKSVDSPYTSLIIKSVSDSILMSSKPSLNNDLKQALQNVLSEKQINSFMFIRSPVFQLITNSTFNLPLKTLIKIDKVVNLTTNDYCLALLENNEWSCVHSISFNDNMTEKAQTFIQKDGIYSVIVEPKSVALLIQASNCDFWCDNGDIIIGCVVGILVVGLIIGISLIIFSKAAKKKKNVIINPKYEVNSEDDAKRLKENIEKLKEKEKILSLSEQEKNNAKEQNESLAKQANNIEKEINDLKKQLLVEQN